MGVFNERVWRVERHGRQVPVVMQHNVTADRYDVTVGGFSVPMRTAQAPSGETVLSFVVQGQSVAIVISVGEQGPTYDLQLGEELPLQERTPAQTRSPVALGSAGRPAPTPAQGNVPAPHAVVPMAPAPAGMVPMPPERSSMPRGPAFTQSPAKKSSTALYVVLGLVGVLVVGGLVVYVAGEHITRGLLSLVEPKLTWKSYEPAEGRFHIEMPDTMKEQAVTQQTAAGPLTMHNYIAEAKTRTFGVSYFDIPFQIPADQANKVLESGRDTSVSQMKGRLIQSQRTQYLGYPALEYTADVPTGTTTQRAFLIGSRLYYLSVVGLKPLKEEEVEKFFSSFSLTRL